MNIRRLLVANRGEIAVRIIRTCRNLGIETALAASEADLDAVPARLADHTVCIGPAHASKSYLKVEAVVGAAAAAKADAIHPGYGFLAENVGLARACRERGIVFIGPTEAQLEAVGDKMRAREHAVAAGLPVAPGGSVGSAAEAAALAEVIGVPLLVKAVAGGGGRGMKLVTDRARVAETVELAMAEADAAFADPRVYLERFVTAGRHVEVQIIGDGRDVVHLGDRDCSVQRRHQKLVEEAPAPGLPETARAAMHEAAIAFGKRLGYRGLGTIEFLLDRDRGAFYFLEMNARIQVEHPVTEAVTGVDLVAEQIALAEGRPLRLRQKDIRLRGHAIECRLNAEDWTRNFRPSPGTVKTAIFPAGAGIRVDTHIEGGTLVPPFYDALLAKIVVHAADREAAIERMKSGLAGCRVDGVATNRDMHLFLLALPEFLRGGMDTPFFSRALERREGDGSRSS